MIKYPVSEMYSEDGKVYIVDATGDVLANVVKARSAVAIANALNAMNELPDFKSFPGKANEYVNALNIWLDREKHVSTKK